MVLTPIIQSEALHKQLELMSMGPVTCPEVLMMASILRHGFRCILAASLVAVPLVMGAGAAHAARARELPVAARVELNPPAPTPEPAAAIVFGLGVGLVAWKSRRSRPSA